MSRNKPVDEKNKIKSSKINSGFFSFIKKNRTSVSMLILIAVLFITYGYYNQKIKTLDRNHREEVAFLTDSINIFHMKNNVRVFSWAIRSELSRGNMEQIDQFFTSYLQTLNVKKIQLINPSDSTIIISTDRKDLEKIEENPEILNAMAIKTIEKKQNYIIVNPIMGLDKKIGIIVVEMGKN